MTEKRNHHVNGRKSGNHGAKIRRRAYPSADSKTVLREGPEYGRRGNRSYSEPTRKGKKK